MAIHEVEISAVLIFRSVVLICSPDGTNIRGSRSLSRSFILQSVTGQQGAGCHHIILLALSLKFPKKLLKLLKIAVVNNPTLIWGSRQEEAPRISAYTLYFQKLESLAYIFVAACMGLSSFNFVQWPPKTHLFCTRVRLGRSRSFRVIQGRWFWYQLKARMGLPISRSL